VEELYRRVLTCELGEDERRRRGRADIYWIDAKIVEEMKPDDRFRIENRLLEIGIVSPCFWYPLDRDCEGRE